MLGRLTSRASLFSAQRFLDLGIATLLIPFSALVGIPAALLVRLTSRGPVFYRQERVGRWGRKFLIYKFRTMRADAEKHTGPVWAAENDPRITRVGRILRKVRVDELPQLWNVIRGDMSLVGPRPERPFFVEELGQKIPLYDARHCVRPGVTGWAQIRYHYAGSEDDARNKLAYELFYVLNRSLTFYFAVLLETVKVVLFTRGSR
jgi:lipopolysaccharide/colanic/teichoic acid biosynthesis glycosyltransferase